MTPDALRESLRLFCAIVASLCAGMKKDDVIARLEGIDCKGRGTSCPDQLARALKAL